ncbi:LOW QUALITY PROTEIN: hypothetical protein E2986_11934 [Frieseomelitta varia]|uniref:Odorant receptor n=1 Tax=Frieseomelitta varia TaxID=561572 RepID=A0A833S148_9HYME|nr:LOW QUALITY PROTEIN: hypothetical protein E2986_11934 [Frieseomelitta varia]
MKDMVYIVAKLIINVCIFIFYNSQSLSISRSVYELKWYDETVKVQKDLLNVLVCQSPMTLSINFLVPELSLRYNCTYVSNALSMCTALQKAISITRFSVALSFCWPLPMNSSRNQIFGYKVAQIFSIVNVTLLLLPCFYAIYLRSNDMEIVSKCISQSICQIQCIAQTVICFCKHNTLQCKLQRIVDELWTCVREAQPYEKEIFRMYIARCGRFYGTYIACAYTITIVYVCGPLFLPIVHVIYAEYPFDVNRPSMTAVVRAHQIIVSHQCCAHVCICVFGAFLIWFTAARFECLGVEVQRCTDIRMLAVCIEKQLRLRRYARDVISCFRFMIFFVIMTCSLVMTLCAILMIMVNSMQQNTSLLVKLMFSFIAFFFLLYLYMYAWPADHMKNMVYMVDKLIINSLSISRSVYELKWYDETVRMQKDLLNVLVCQSPLKLSISFLVPELSLQRAFSITRFSVALSFCWPLPMNSSRNQIFGYKVAQIFSIVNVTLLILFLFYAIYLRSGDIEIVSKCIGQSILQIQCIVQTVVCFCKHDTLQCKLQRIVDELWTCIREAQPYEKEIFRIYIARCGRFYGTYIACAYTITIFYVYGPLFLPIIHIFHVEYPFDVNRTLMNAVTRAHLIIACQQSCAHVCVCVFGAFLIWFTAARFECLGVEVQRCTDIRMLAVCIEKHLRLRRYARDVMSCFRFMIFFVIITCTLMMTLSVIIMVMKIPLLVKLPFASGVLVFLMYLYMYTWPADHMKDMVYMVAKLIINSLSISHGVYELKWYDETVRMQKDLLKVLVFESPEKLSVNFLVPELSLLYYCTYVSNALSMCTALRAILDKTTVIHIIWLCVVITFCWPLPVSSSKLRVLVFKLLIICSGISTGIIVLLLIYTTYLHLDNFVISSKTFCLSICISQHPIQSFMYVVNYGSLQRIVDEMVVCFKEARQYERDIFSKYIAKCNVFYGGTLIFVYITGLVFVMGPVALPIDYPLECEYPFRVNYTSIIIFIYFHQSFVCFQCAAHVCLSAFGAFLLWFTAARFECLAMEFQNSSNIDTLIVCIKKQLHLRRYAEQVVNCLRFLVLYAISVGTCALTLCGIIMIVVSKFSDILYNIKSVAVFMNSPQVVKTQFITISVTMLIQVYMFAWPADYMKEWSINVSRSVYDGKWYKQSLKLQKMFLNVMLYQKPITLSISCLLEELSLRYYCSLYIYLLCLYIYKQKKISMLFPLILLDQIIDRSIPQNVKKKVL